MPPSDAAIPSNLDVRKVLLFCLPALVVGLVFRVVMMVQWPFAFVISDTHEFFGSTLNPLDVPSRTFLPKLLYRAPLLFHAPVLPWAAFIQHVAGLGAVVVTGFLTRLWLQRWRWWIVPITLLMAIHPTLLWYEHMCLPDSIFVALILLSSLCGGLYFRRPSAPLLAALIASLWLTAGARQEGFLLLPFAFLLVISRHRLELHAQARRIATVAALILAGVVTNQTSQGGLMLLTSTIQMAPDELWFSKPLSPVIAELRDQFKTDWSAYPANHNASRKIIAARIGEFLAASSGSKTRIPDAVVARTCKVVAVEIAVRNIWRLPGLAFHKFLATHTEPASPDFGPAWLHRKHLSIFFGKPGEPPPKDHRLLSAYYGRTFESAEQAASELPKMYPVMEPDWMSKFQEGFVGAENFLRFPDRQLGNQILPGMRLLYLIGFAGLLLTALQRRPWLGYEQLWLLFLLFEAFAAFMTSSLRSRYRLPYEAWWFIGVFCFAETVGLTAQAAWKASREGNLAGFLTSWREPAPEGDSLIP